MPGELVDGAEDAGVVEAEVVAAVVVVAFIVVVVAALGFDWEFCAYGKREI